MSLFSWYARRSGGIAMIALSVLSYWVISRESAAIRASYKNDPQASLSASRYPPNGAGALTILFSYYCLFIHVLVFAFPLRACWAIWELTSTLRKNISKKSLKDIKFGHGRRGSSTSLSSSETLTSSRASSSASSEAGDLEADLYSDATIPDADAQARIVHAIIIPNYKEETDTIRETLDVLACHPQARNSYDVSIVVFWFSDVGSYSLSKPHGFIFPFPVSWFPLYKPYSCW